MTGEIKLNGIPTSISQFAHAYIVEGTDKEALFHQSERLAKTLLCRINFNADNSHSGSNLSPIEPPCGHCHSCELYDAKNHPDYLLAQAEKTSIGVDDIRQISSFLNKTSQLSGNQVVVVDQAQLMTESASNALLKTLEEPTDKSFLFLLVDTKSKLLPTILSRCQFLTLDGLSKEQLKQKYNDLPDYLLGFGSKSESDIQRWIESEKLEQFEEVYQLFIGWLKRQTPVTTFANLVSSDTELHDFSIYLIGRRLRQLMLKGAKVAQANEATDILNRYIKAQRQIVGMNKSLAIQSLLTQLTSRV